MSEHLVVMPRNQADARHHLMQDVAGIGGLRILQDRRHGERRQHAQPYEPERRRSDRRRSRPEGEDANARPLPAGRPRPSIEIVRRPEGAVEIKLSGLVGGLERRIWQWQAVALGLVLSLVLGASVALAMYALRWDYEHGRTVALLRSDLEVARVRARCWEAVARYAPKSPEDVISEAGKSEWVKQCVAAELARLNPR